MWHAFGCQNVEQSHLPDSLSGYVSTGFCSEHAAMLRRGLLGPSTATILSKLLTYISSIEPELIVCVRRFARPHLLSGRYNVQSARIDQDHHPSLRFYRCLLNLV